MGHHPTPRRARGPPPGPRARRHPRAAWAGPRHRGRGGRWAPAPTSGPYSAARVRLTRGERPGSPDQRANTATLPVDPVAAPNTAATAATVSSTVRGTHHLGRGRATRATPRGHRRRRPGPAGLDPVGDGGSLADETVHRRSLGRRPEGALGHQRGEPGPHRTELVLVEDLTGPVRVPAPEGQVVDVHVEGHVAHQRDDLGVGPDLSGAGGQVLAQLRRQGVEVGEQGVEVAVLVDQLGRRLLPHPGDPGKVVGGIAAQRGQQRVLLGPYPGALLDARLVVEGVVAHAPPVVEHPDVGILDQLVGVAVAGDDDDRMLAVPGLGGQRGQHVVGLEPLGADHRDGQRSEQGPDHVELGREIGGGLGPAALVVLGDLVAEGPPGKIEGDGQPHRPVVPHQVHHHRCESVDGVGDHACGGGQIGRQGEVGPEGQRHPVQEDQRGRGGIGGRTVGLTRLELGRGGLGGHGQPIGSR